MVRPPAQEIAALFLGLEDAYRYIAVALGYPPHFLRVTAVSNPDLKVSIEGADKAIEALRKLIEALPRLVASLFRPRAAWELAGIEAETQQKQFEADAATAAADAAEANVRRLKAEREARALQEQMSIAPDEETHTLVLDIARYLQAADHTRSATFVAGTAEYLSATRAYRPWSRIVLVPIQ